MAILVDNQNVNFSGNRSFGPVAVPDGLSHFKISFARNRASDNQQWQNASTQIAASVFISVDGGANFTFLVGFTAEGGVHLRADGTQSPESAAFIDMPLAPSRQVRADVVVTNGPFRSRLTVEAT